MEFVRSSASTRGASPLAWADLSSASRVSVRAISAALACCSGITSTSASATVSMRAMMPATRVTLLARSEITSELLLVWAMSCAPCGSSGRRIGTSSAAAMCRSGTICVTMASPDSAVATVLPPSA